jgi:hypothetical protein
MSREDLVDAAGLGPIAAPVVDDLIARGVLGTAEVGGGGLLFLKQKRLGRSRARSGASTISRTTAREAPPASSEQPKEALEPQKVETQAAPVPAAPPAEPWRPTVIRRKKQTATASAV